MRYFLLALGLCAAYIPTAADAQRVRERCEVGRCVYYDRTGKRLGSVTRDDTGRLEVRDRRGRIQAKVTEERDGSRRVEKPRFGREDIRR